MSGRHSPERDGQCRTGVHTGVRRGNIAWRGIGRGDVTRGVPRTGSERKTPSPNCGMTIPAAAPSADSVRASDCQLQHCLAAPAPIACVLRHPNARCNSRMLDAERGGSRVLQHRRDANSGGPAGVITLVHRTGAQGHGVGDGGQPGAAGSGARRTGRRTAGGHVPGVMTPGQPGWVGRPVDDGHL